MPDIREYIMNWIAFSALIIVQIIFGSKKSATKWKKPIGARKRNGMHIGRASLTAIGG